jgi:beta-phosphoglucomutase-like phosphatase (HAD superfamily)
MQRTYECKDGVLVETVFIHESGEVMECGMLHLPASKLDAMGFGSCLTYARRYSLLAATGLAPEDDDGVAASRRTEIKSTVNESQIADLLAAMDEVTTIKELQKPIKRRTRRQMASRHGRPRSSLKKTLKRRNWKRLRS